MDIWVILGKTSKKEQKNPACHVPFMFPKQPWLKIGACTAFSDTPRSPRFKASQLTGMSMEVTTVRPSRKLFFALYNPHEA